MTHQMHLLQIYDTGAQEWLCATCGYQFIAQWPRRIVLCEGDGTAAHCGGAGGVQVEGMDARQEPPLSPLWLAALDDVLD